MGVGSQESDDVQSIFRFCTDDRTGRTTPYLGEICNWLKLFDFILSPDFRFFIRRLNHLVRFLNQSILCRLNELVSFFSQLILRRFNQLFSFLCQPEIFD